MKDMLSKNGDPAPMPEHVSARLAGIDEIYAAMSTELSCVNILVFDRPSTTFSTMVETFQEWQTKVPCDTQRVLEPALRRNAERLIRYGLLDRQPARNERREFEHTMTNLGIVASAFSGHTLELANRSEVNLTELNGTKVRVIKDTSVHDRPRFSSPLYRTMTLAAIANYGRNTGDPVRGSDIPSLPGLDGVKMSDAQKLKHARELADAGYLAIDSIVLADSGTGVGTHHYSVDQDRAEVVNELEDLLRHIHTIDEAWPDFINDGLRKAREIKKDPEIIARLLETRASSSQTAYEVSASELRDVILGLSENTSGGFTNQQLVARLGGKHDKHYISNRLGSLVDSGYLKATCPEGSNRFRYSLATS